MNSTNAWDWWSAEVNWATPASRQAGRLLQRFITLLSGACGIDAKGTFETDRFTHLARENVEQKQRAENVSKP